MACIGWAPFGDAAKFLVRGGKIASELTQSTLKNVDLPKGSFSIIDWKDYPANLPKPVGPFRMVDGQEYTAARAAANKANAAIHKADSSFNGMQIHELHPIKFGGDPVSLKNKVPLTPLGHAEASIWWLQLQKDLLGK